MIKFLLAMMALMQLVIIGYDIIDLKHRLTFKRKELPDIIRKDREIDRLHLLLKTNGLQKINNLIDGLIEMAVNKYMVLNVNHNIDPYINKQQSKELMDYCFGTVKQNMTTEIRSIISLIYDISDENKLDELLKLRIKLYTLQIIVNINSPK